MAHGASVGRIQSLRNRAFLKVHWYLLHKSECTLQKKKKLQEFPRVFRNLLLHTLHIATLSPCGVFLIAVASVSIYHSSSEKRKKNEAKR